MDELEKVVHEARKTGDESIVDEDGCAVSSMQRFWQWAHSSLLDNIERGIFAEFLVASALGVDAGIRENWSSYDLQTTDGITVEVKATGYIQPWGQKKLQSPKFPIRPTRAWDQKSASFADSQQRQAEVYVFCVHNYQHKDENINQLDLKQWDFYVLPTAVLDEKKPGQKSIALSVLRKIGAVQCSYAELPKAVQQAGLGASREQ